MKWILRVVPYLILLIALTILSRELQHIRWEDLSRTLLDYSWPTFALALLFLGLNYLVWTAYDWISLRQLGLRVPCVQIFRTAAVAFPITNLVGYSLITGFATRLRNYEPLGLSYVQITKLILFNISSWWIGFLFLCGVAVIYSPDGKLFHMSSESVRWIGIGLLAVVTIYLVFAWWTRGREFHWGRWHMHLPSLRSGMLKILVSSLDNLLVGLTLFVFLPSAHEVSFTRFMAYFLSAYLVALLSFVPAGWGVLEGVLLYLFRPYAPDAEILASMVLFRVFHYLMPVTLAFIGVSLRKLATSSRRQVLNPEEI